MTPEMGRRVLPNDRASRDAQAARAARRVAEDPAVRAARRAAEDRLLELMNKKRESDRGSGEPLTDEEWTEGQVLDLAVFGPPGPPPVPVPAWASRLDDLIARLLNWSQRPDRPMTPFREWRIRRGTLLCPTERQKTIIEVISALVVG
jgi:hypothetical protein